MTSEKLSNEELVRKYQDEDDMEALDELIRNNEGLLRMFASKCRKRQSVACSFDDLLQEGRIGMVIAAGKFDPSFGVKFTSYAECWILQRMKKYSMDMINTIYLPEYVRTELSKVSKALESLPEEVSSYDDKVAYVSKTTDFSTSKVEKLIDLLYHHKIVEIDDDLSEVIEDPHCDVEAEAIVSATFEDIGKKVLRKLTDREAEIIEMRYGVKLDDFGVLYSKEMTLEEVGKHYNLTRERIRQIEKKGLRKALRAIKDDEWILSVF